MSFRLKLYNGEQALLYFHRLIAAMNAADEIEDRRARGLDASAAEARLYRVCNLCDCHRDPDPEGEAELRRAIEISLRRRREAENRP